jgi:hypothetical protein
MISQSLNSPAPLVPQYQCLCRPWAMLCDVDVPDHIALRFLFITQISFLGKGKTWKSEDCHQQKENGLFFMIEWVFVIILKRNQRNQL